MMAKYESCCCYVCDENTSYNEPNCAGECKIDNVCSMPHDAEGCKVCPKYAFCDGLKGQRPIGKDHGVAQMKSRRLVSWGFEHKEEKEVFRWWERKLGENSMITVGMFFNSCFEVAFDNGCESYTAVAANIRSFEDIKTIERLFAGNLVDSGPAMTRV